MRTLHLIAGLPRSGSTLLCNLLAQNPRFHATATSGLLELLFLIRNHWDGFAEMQAMPAEKSEAKKRQVLGGVVHGYFAEIEQPVIFDKARGWLAHLELIEWVLGQEVRVLVPVRDLRDVLSSFELLWRKTSASRQMRQEHAHYLQMQSVEGRCALWAREDQPVGLAYNRIKDALQRGYGSRLHFVRYERLTRHPEAVLQEIYDFLQEPHCPHNPQHVEQVTQENDLVYGLPALHTIRPRIEPQAPHWPTVLGPQVAQRYAALELW